MLPVENRIVSAEDFRMVGRRGRRVSGPFLVLQILRTGSNVSRFGFVVPNTVGDAVERNLVKRRLREIAAEVIRGVPKGLDVVVRVHSNVKSAPFGALRDELLAGVKK